MFNDGCKRYGNDGNDRRNEKARIERYMDSIRSAISANTKKAEDYKAALAKFKPEIELGGENPVVVNIVDED